MTCSYRSNAAVYDIVAWVIAGAALLFVLKLSLLPALLSGLLVYELVHLLSPRLRPAELSGAPRAVPHAPASAAGPLFLASSASGGLL